jgi:hypothetical protein
MVETDVFDSYLRCYSSTGSGAASLVLVWCPTSSDLDWYDSALEIIPPLGQLVLWKTNMLSLAVQSCLRLYVSEQLQGKNIEDNRTSRQPFFLLWTMDTAFHLDGLPWWPIC